MFRFERDMIPVLKQSLAKLYNTEYFVEEFSSGLGIADLVFATGITKRDMALHDFEAMYYINNYFCLRRKKIDFDETVRANGLKKDKAKLALKYLRDLNILNDHHDGTFSIQSAYLPSTAGLYSVEAKLKDWKNGFFQAMRYKNYSQKTFLAVSSEYIHRVDKDLLKENNVGLFSVSLSHAQMILNPKKETPLNTTAFCYLSESFVSRYLG